MQTLVKNLETQLLRIDNQINVLNSQAAQESRQWEACSQVVLQFEASLNELEHDIKHDAGAEEIAAACSQGPLAPILKMYYSNVTKLDAYAAAKSLSKTALNEAHATKRASTSRLTALQAYLKELCAGKDGVLLRPRPLCNTNEEVVVQKQATVLPFVLECCICCEGFPFMDIVLCVCQHVYHPWCAAHWFRSNVTCAVPMCGLVPETWYSSFGFGEYDKIAIAQGAAGSIEALDNASLVVPPSPPAKSLPGHLFSTAPCVYSSSSFFKFIVYCDFSSYVFILTHSLSLELCSVLQHCPRHAKHVRL